MQKVNPLIQSRTVGVVECLEVFARLVVRGNVVGTCAAKHNDVQQTVCAQTIRAVHGDARTLTRRIQAAHNSVWGRVGLLEDLRVRD